MADGIYVFQGLAVGNDGTCENACIQINGNAASLIWPTASESLWFYDENTDSLSIRAGKTTGLITSIVSQISSYGFEASTHVVVAELTKAMVLGKFVPDV